MSYFLLTFLYCKRIIRNYIMSFKLHSYKYCLILFLICYCTFEKKWQLATVKISNGSDFVYRFVLSGRRFNSNSKFSVFINGHVKQEWCGSPDHLSRVARRDLRHSSCSKRRTNIQEGTYLTVRMSLSRIDSNFGRTYTCYFYVSLSRTQQCLACTR